MRKVFSAVQSSKQSCSASARPDLRKNKRQRLGLLTGMVAAAAAVLLPAMAAQAKDMMVVMSRPNDLHVIDLDSNEILRSCPVPGEFGPAVTIISPDTKVAYVLNHRWENVYGIEIDTCKLVFQAEASSGDLRVKSLGSLAISQDGSEIYTIHTPTRLAKDHYEVLPTELAVYKTDAGLDAKPVRKFPVPRRITTMATGADNALYMGGHDIYKMDTQTGKIDIAIANRSWDRPTYGGPDVLAFWPIGGISDEYMLMYSAPKFATLKMEEMVDYVWGVSRVDLETGATLQKDFASFEVIMFSGITSPTDSNTLFGVYTQLSKHDIKNGKLIKRVDLPHTYYCVNMSSDGKKVYVGGTNDDIGIYDSETLERIGEIILPGGGDQGTATVQVFTR